MAHLSPFILRQSHASHVQAKAILPPDSERDKVILIPIGHTEQHGFHLPLSVDTIIIDAIAKGTVLRTSMTDALENTWNYAYRWNGKSRG
jgi:creatinine amidohydrolase